MAETARPENKPCESKGDAAEAGLVEVVLPGEVELPVLAVC